MNRTQSDPRSPVAYRRYIPRIGIRNIESNSEELKFSLWRKLQSMSQWTSVRPRDQWQRRMSRCQFYSHANIDLIIFAWVVLALAHPPLGQTEVRWDIFWSLYFALYSEFPLGRLFHRQPCHGTTYYRQAASSCRQLLHWDVELCTQPNIP